MSSPVTPQDAASVVLYREGPRGCEVLMGRRPPRSRFIPDAFVFPGGKVDPEDWKVAPAAGLEPDVETALRATRKCTKTKAQALANAAIRETYEETGLMVAAPKAEPMRADLGTWDDFGAKGLAPSHQAFRCLARAITPPESPIRFHARFLTVPATATIGSLRASPELLDLAWFPVEDALKLPLVDVTEVVLEEILALAGQDRLASDQPQGRVLFMSYRANNLMKRYIEPARSS